MKKFMTVLLAVAVLFSALGCSGKSADKRGAATLLNGFEDFERDVQIIKLLNGFGQVNVNTDSRYVKSGKSSLKLRPNGWEFSTIPPYIVVPTYSTRYNYGYGDFTKTDKISVSVYNAESEPLEIGVGLTLQNIYTEQWYDSVQRLNAEYYTLAPGWNDLVYAIEPDYFSKHPSFDIKQIYGVYFEFGHIGARSIDDTPTVYLDDLYLHSADNRAASGIKALQSDRENGVWEISYFDDVMQNYFYYVSLRPFFCAPTVKVVPAAKYGINAKKGLYVLEATKRAGTGEYGWPYIWISEDIMKGVLADIGDDIKLNPENYVFKYDMYNASAYDGGWSMEFYTDDEVESKTYTTVSAKSGAWATYSCSFKTINNGLLSKGKKYTEAPGAVRITGSQYNTADDTSDRVFLFDNVRIERIV